MSATALQVDADPCRVAHELASHGLPVFPCFPDSKRPKTTNGFYDASLDPEQIERWFTGTGALVAVPTGEKTQLLVIDIDPTGAEWYRQNAERLACARVHKTRRGHHLLYRQPAGAEIRNSASKIAPGVDVRASGGYVVWWPAHGHEAIGDLLDLTEPPAWLVALILSPAPQPHLQSIQQAGTIAEPGRNAALASLAGKMRRAGASVEEIESALASINARRCSPPLEAKEVEAIARSIARYPTASSDTAWSEPLPLPEGLPPVPAFDLELLPSVLRARVEDIAERMQCPPDFPAVALVVTLSSIVGRRCAIQPKRQDDWIVVPNLWGMVIGRPGIMKSPPLAEVMKPLLVLQARARELFENSMADYEAGQLLAEQAARVTKDRIHKALKSGQQAAAEEYAHQAVATDVDLPVCRRYVINDSTVEKLGELLKENPSGLLVFRDELAGFFRTLERSGHEADRAFYLECWNGDGSFTYDRIGRGTLHIPAACVSMLGAIQPGPLRELVRGLRGSGDDGFLQRFQLAVWPDATTTWRNVDRFPDARARDAVTEVFKRIDTLEPTDPIRTMRFAAEAQELFDAWRESLEVRLRENNINPVMEAHLAKYRSLVPALALVLHLAETLQGPVSLLALERAVAWAEYLERHAERIYAPAISPDLDSARVLAKRIESGEVAQRFSLRDIYNNCWSGLTTRDEVQAAVSVLTDHDWLRSEEEPTPGRTRTVYVLNPALVKEQP
jgi:hypothetical protein